MDRDLPPARHPAGGSAPARRSGTERDAAATQALALSNPIAFPDTRTHARANTHTSTHTSASTRPCASTRTNARTSPCTRAHTHTCTRPCARTRAGPAGG